MGWLKHKAEKNSKKLHSNTEPTFYNNSRRTPPKNAAPAPLKNLSCDQLWLRNTVSNYRMYFSGGRDFEKMNCGTGDGLHELPGDGFPELPGDEFPDLLGDGFPDLPGDAFPDLPGDGFPDLPGDRFPGLPGGGAPGLPGDSFHRLPGNRFPGLPGGGAPGQSSGEGILQLISRLEEAVDRIIPT